MPSIAQQAAPMPLRAAQPPRNSVDGYYRFTDILFEWDKQLDRDSGSAIKTLINTNALAHPAHPLRSKGKDGVEVYLGTFADGKVRALFSFKQVAYLRYYVRATGLVDAIAAKRAADGPSSGTVEETHKEEDGTTDEIPLPSSRNLLYRDQMVELTSVIIRSVATAKLIKRDARKVLKQLEAGTLDAAPATPVSPSSAEPAAPVSSPLGPDSKGIEIGPAVRREPGPATTYFHAEQAYIIASTGGRSPAYAVGHAASGKYDKKAGRGLFLCMDFAFDGATLLDLGFAASWWDGKTERVEQGHWIVKEYHRADASAPDDDAVHGVTPGANAYISDHPSEILPFADFKQRLANLVPDMQAKLQPNGGPIYLVIHSAEKPLEMLSLLDLPIKSIHTSLHPKDQVSEAYASAAAIGQIYVIDTSELITALEAPAESANNGGPSPMPLEEACHRIFYECEEPLTGFGHSGNNAFLNLQLFLCLAAQPLEIARNNFTLARYDEMQAQKLAKALDINSETPLRWDQEAGSDTSSLNDSIVIGIGGPEEGLSDEE